jgi:hypothetical protein
MNKSLYQTNSPKIKLYTVICTSQFVLLVYLTAFNKYLNLKHWHSFL